MSTQDLFLNAPITSKVAYAKILFLRDREKFKDQPVFTRRLRGSISKEGVYDSAIYYFFTLFGKEKPARYEWKFSSSEGKIDNVLQLYPFDASKFNADPSKDYDSSIWDNIIIPHTDGVIVVAHYYNSFQRGEKGEWAGIRAEKDVEELRMVVDFSSVIANPNEELFVEEPTAYLGDPVTKAEKSISLEYRTGKIFAASATNVPEGNVLKLKWKMNWEGLATWQGYADGKKITPEILHDKIQQNPQPGTTINLSGDIRVFGTIGSSGGTQNVNVNITEKDFQELKVIINSLRELLKNTDLPADKGNDLNAEIQTIEGQLSSSKPKLDTVKSSLKSTKEILEEVAGVVVAAVPIIIKIGSWLNGIP